MCRGMVSSPSRNGMNSRSPVPQIDSLSYSSFFFFVSFYFFLSLFSFSTFADEAPNYSLVFDLVGASVRKG